VVVEALLGMQVVQQLVDLQEEVLETAELIMLVLLINLINQEIQEHMDTVIQVVDQQVILTKVQVEVEQLMAEQLLPHQKTVDQEVMAEHLQ
jgi:hypothetical protein